MKNYIGVNELSASDRLKEFQTLSPQKKAAYLATGELCEKGNFQQIQQIIWEICQKLFSFDWKVVDDNWKVDDDKTYKISSLRYKADNPDAYKNKNISVINWSAIDNKKDPTIDFGMGVYTPEIKRKLKGEMNLNLLWAFLHELGHAIDGLPQKKQKSLDYQLKREIKAWDNAKEIFFEYEEDLMPYLESFKERTQYCLKEYRKAMKG